MNNTPEEFTKFSTVMWGVAEDFGGKLSKDGLKMKFRALQEFSIDQITAAGTWLLKNRERVFPPLPTTKEFIAAIQNIDGGMSTKNKAEIEVDKVFKALRVWGREAQPLFHDKITTYLMTHRWNFQQLDGMHVRDPGFGWFRRRFVEAYQDLSKDSPAIENLLVPSYDDAKKVSANRLKLLVPSKSMEG